MSQNTHTTPETPEMLDSNFDGKNLVFNMIGIKPENSLSATGFIDPSTVEAMYDLASKLYSAGEYKDADTLFQMLCYYQNGDPRFWMGLGGCRQAAGTPQSAMEAYLAAAYLQQLSSPQPLFFLALCLLRMGARDTALQALHLLAELKECTTPADRECLEKGRKLLEAIEAEMKKAQ